MSYSVLIIDDEPMICMGLLALIDWKSFGFSVTDVRFSYAEGLSAAMSGNYSLIISDIRLHDESGLELIRKVRNADRCDQFILLSAYADFSYAQTAIELGVRQYLLKPLRAELLGEAIRKFTEDAHGKEPSASGKTTEKERTSRHSHVDEALSYIHENYADAEASLAKFAAGAYLNPSYLGQQFRSVTGYRFTDYLNRYRVFQAGKLLLSGRYKNYEIAIRCGFNSETYFYRVFCRYTGLSPMEYTRKIRSGDGRPAADPGNPS